MAAKLDALSAGRIDALHRIGASELEAVGQPAGVNLLRVRAANTVCIRMKPTERPFNDLRVRKAIVLAADNRAMLDGAIRGNGMLGENHHVAPIHPEYTALPPLRRDVARAKELLAQAEYEDGIDIELTVGNTQGRFEEETARILQKSLAEANIRLKLNVVPAQQYWPTWMKLNFGMTYWAHRPLGVTALDLAYRSGAAWNETGFADQEFDRALDRALALVDPRQRAVPIATCEKILQDACIMVQPFWLDETTVVAEKVRDFRAHPSDYYRLQDVWLA
jgi:peptide/nickel transport system substrate-binding protein